MTEKERTLKTILVLAQQLDVWLKHARELGNMSKELKYRGTVLNNAVHNLNRLFFGNNSGESEYVYEQSVYTSEIIEQLCELDEDQANRVMNLIKKLKREKEQVPA